MCRRVTSACNDDTRLQGFLANVTLKERAFSSIVLEVFRGEYIFVFSLSETLNDNIFFRLVKRLRSLCDRINPLQFSFGDYTEKFCFLSCLVKTYVFCINVLTHYGFHLGIIRTNFINFITIVMCIKNLFLK